METIDFPTLKDKLELIQKLSKLSDDRLISKIEIESSGYYTALKKWGVGGSPEFQVIYKLIHTDLESAVNELFIAITNEFYKL